MSGGNQDARLELARVIAGAVRRLAPECADFPVLLERPKEAAHGDYACNIALQLARTMKRPPREIAKSLIASLSAIDHLEKAEIAGAGFINFFLKPDYKRQVVQRVLAAGAEYGRSTLGRGRPVQVEFVSANPTGPLHVGHGRGAAYGASLANVLAAAGYDVTREFYVNDAGRQIDILAVSTWLRYLGESGIAAAFPPNAYQGDYVRAMARKLLAAHGSRFHRGVTARAIADWLTGGDDEARLDELIAGAKSLLGPDYEVILGHALGEQLADCRDDLARFGVDFDNWFSERSLHERGLVERALAALAAGGHLYEQDGAQWFRSSAFGDEKDRVVRRENGQYTYFASDIAYHLEKFARGFDRVIDVWGADHHGYIARVKGALAAAGLDPQRLTVALVQFAVLYRGVEKVSMSTRAGEFVTLRELRAEVGNDAARFFYVMRKADQHLDFDLDLARSQSQENPVYYVQYAHARVSSLLEQWGGEPRALATADTGPLVAEHETALLARLMAYPETLEDAARDLAPHLIAFYLRDLAGEFHSFYNSTRILVGDKHVKLARLALAAAVRVVVRNGLALLGVGAPERM
ncbi:MAG: arginine--tRNA ligase [Burkholderiales bacterium]|nr:arginine--tRNA ligase [Burkholderiales bacterium]